MGLNPQSSISKKILMGITGILMLGFLAAHLTGNLLLFSGADAFNAYAHTLTSQKLLLYTAELGLLVIFVGHAITGIRLSIENANAREVDYTEKKWLGKRTLSSYTMMISGSIILLFLIVHIVTFKYGTYYETESGIRDLYKLVTEWFQKPWYSMFYIVSMVCLGFHIAHAFQSVLKTLGLGTPKYVDLAEKISIGLAIFFTVGFSSFPVYFSLSAA